MKEESHWPMVSYIASIIGAAAVLILRLYAFQMGGSHFSSGRLLPLLLALSPFAFGALAINFNTNPRAIQWLSVVILLQTVATVLGYCYAIFGMVGVEGATTLGMLPLYQFLILGIAAGAVQFLREKKGPHHHRK